MAVGLGILANPNSSVGRWGVFFSLGDGTLATIYVDTKKLRKFVDEGWVQRFYSTVILLCHV